MTAAPYKTAAFKYLTHGWKGPIPVGTQPNQKTHPPQGYTGTDGAWPNDDQIADWVQTRPQVNIALRLPEHVIGIDVDTYGDKPGADTMTATTQQHGRLPRTWITTSRQGTKSGIRWFRIPQPGPLPGKLVHPHDPDISGVEIIQHTHRYAIVPPSIHPEGGTYRWIRPDQTTTTEIPRPADLPMLPQAWLDHINQDCSCWAPFRWDKYQPTGGSDPVAATYHKWSARITEAYGRHDGALGGVMALTAFKQKGWPGADHYLDQLHEDFIRSLADSRTSAQAEAEWDRMTQGAETKAHTTQIPQWEPHQTPTPRTPETFDVRVEEELDKLRVRDKATRRFRLEQNPPQPLPPILTLKERLKRPLPPLDWRIDGWQPAGTRVMLAAQFKAGKTTLTGNLARSLADGDPWLGKHQTEPVERVTVLDFEMSERQIDAWLADQQIRHTERIVVIPMRGRAAAFNILDDDTRQRWAEILTGSGYLIVDCLRPILDAIGLDEHREGGRFLTAFDALCDTAGIPDALMVHHMGHTEERARGDSRFRDWPDVEWRLVRDGDDPASDRYISAYGRDVEQYESKLQYDDQTRHLTLVGGTRANAKAREALTAVTRILEGADEPMSTRQIIDALLHTDHSRRRITDALSYGIHEGEIEMRKGARNAHLYTLTAPVRHTAPELPRNGPHDRASAYMTGAVVHSPGADTTAPPTTEEIAP